MLFPRVLAAAGGLLWNVAPGQCAPEFQTGAGVANAELESRQELFFPENADRKERVIQLQSQITAMEQTGADFWELYDSKTDFYKDILHQIAVAKGFTSVKEMIKEKIQYALYPIERDAVQDVLDDYDDVKEVHTIFWATGGAIATVALPSEYALQKHRLFLAKESGMSSAIKATTTRWGANMKIQKARWQQRVGLISRAEMIEKIETFRIPIAKLELKGFWKWFSRFTSFLEVVDVGIFIGELIFEGIAGAQMRDDLRDMIRELYVARFAAYTEQKAMLALQSWNDVVWASFLNRASLQNLVNQGNLCYDAAETELLLQLEIASDQYFQETVLDDSVYQDYYNEVKNIYDDDSTWTDDDPSFNKVMEIIEEAEQEWDAENGGEVEDPAPEGTYTVTGTDVPAAELAYVEFADNKGAMWKLNGPQWSIQFPFDVSNAAAATEVIDVDGDGTTPSGTPRAELYSHHMLQLEQTTYPNKIFLQTAQVYDPSGGIFTSTGDIVVIDLDTHTLRKIASPPTDDTWINVPESQWVDFFGFTMNVAALTNRLPENFWTASAVIDAPDSTGFYPSFFECNKKVGWDWEGQSGLVYRINEIKRDASSIEMRHTSWFPTVSVTQDDVLFSLTACSVNVPPPACPEWVTTEEQYERKSFNVRGIFA